MAWAKCNPALPFTAVRDRVSVAQFDGGGLLRFASGQRRIGCLGLGPQEPAQHDVPVAGNAGVWMVCKKARSRALWAGCRAVRLRPDEQAASHHLPLLALALGLLAAAATWKLPRLRSSTNRHRPTDFGEDSPS